MSKYVVIEEPLSFVQKGLEQSIEDARNVAASTRKTFLVCQIVGKVVPHVVYEDLAEPEPEPPKKKALDVTLEQREKTVIATLKHIDPKLAARYSVKSVTLATDGTYKVCLMRDFKIYGGLRDLTVGRCGTVSAEDFGTVRAAAEYVERIGKLIDEINANEPQEGGEA
jgi:hypothetical protein